MRAREPEAAIDGKWCMGIGIRHVVAVSAALGAGAFVYVVGFAPMDEVANPRAGALGRVPARATMINTIRRSLAFEQLAAADRAADMLVEHNPEDPGAYFWRATVDMKLGDVESALGSWVRLDRLMQGLSAWTERYSAGELDYFRAWAKVGIGEIEQGQAIFRKVADDLEARSDLESDHSDQLRIVHYNLACYRAMGGEIESAMEHWALAVELGYGRDSGWWAADPDLEPLHGDDRFWTIGQGVDPDAGADEEVDGGVDEPGG